MKTIRQGHGYSKRGQRFFLSIPLVLLALIALLPLRAHSAQAAGPGIWQVQRLESSETGLSDPAGLAFSTRLKYFEVLERGPASATAQLARVRLPASRAGADHIPAAISNPINITYDNQAGRLLFMPAPGNQVLEIRPGADGSLSPSSMARHEIPSLNIADPQGMAVDPSSGDLFILDASGPGLFRLQVAHGTFSVIDISASGISAPRGLAIDPVTGSLYVMGPPAQSLYEFSQAGDLLALRDMSGFGLNNPQGMVFAPSSDQTDAASNMNLFLADGSTAANQGQVVEFTLVAPASLPAGTTLLPASVVNTFLTASWANPAPDPSGIDYWPAKGQLVISDSEVEEIVGGHPPAYWHGYNVFMSTPTGTLAGNCTTYSGHPKNQVWNDFTAEPAGFAINTDNGHFFFSQDGTRSAVFDIGLGPDGTYCTPDDTVTRVLAYSIYGTSDSEDVGYGNDTLFIADGVNAEVYVIPLGADGVLGGGDDGPVTHWDTASLGFSDLEGICYNPDNGTLFIVSTKGTDNYLGETTLGGKLLRAYDLSFMGTQGNIRSDVAYAPSSYDPSVKSIYIASRGIDNNSNRLENDGKIWEINISGSALPTPTAGPSPTPTPTQQVTDNIFADGFEAGNLSAWSSSVTDAGNLSVSGSAALAGSQGMQAFINDNNSIYVTDETPASELRYRARFYFDPNSISMLSGDVHNIFTAYSGNTLLASHRVVFRYYNGAYQLRAALIDDASTWHNSNWFTISDAPHFVEFDWMAASGVGTNDGYMTFWIDGSQVANLTGVNNPSQRIEQARLGAVNGVDTGTRGTYYFDAFESRRQTYIGP